MEVGFLVFVVFVDAEAVDRSDLTDSASSSILTVSLVGKSGGENSMTGEALEFTSCCC